jgi:hypothetical protein
VKMVEARSREAEVLARTAQAAFHVPRQDPAGGRTKDFRLSGVSGKRFPQTCAA